MAQIKPMRFAITTFKAPECCKDCPFFVKGEYGRITCHHPEGPLNNHDYKQSINNRCPLQFVEVQSQFVKPVESKSILDSEGFEITKGSIKYEDCITLDAELLKDNDEALKQVLRSYDRLVKEKNGCENLELPYWCYGFCGNDKN